MTAFARKERERLSSQPKSIHQEAPIKPPYVEVFDALTIMKEGLELTGQALALRAIGSLLNAQRQEVLEPPLTPELLEQVERARAYYLAEVGITQPGYEAPGDDVEAQSHRRESASVLSEVLDYATSINPHLLDTPPPVHS
jgi:hypothetical protein